jgi:PilZ domain
MMAWITNRIPYSRSKRRWSIGRDASSGCGLGRRRAHRVDLSAPVFLYCSTNGEPFAVCSETFNVSVNGALVRTNARLFPEQRVLLTNLQTEQDVKCRVVRIDRHRIAAALEFMESCPRFWCIDFASAPARS